MKSMILFFGLFSILLTVNGQNLIINDSIFREGIYKTFEELKYNKPSMEFNYNVITKSHRYGLSNEKGQVPFYKIMINKKEGKSIGKIFGFCDGKTVYINDNSPRLGPDTEFSKIEYFSKYCYFKYVKIRKTEKQKSRAERNMDNAKNIFISNNVGRIMNASTTVIEGRLVEKILNIESGKVISLSTKVLRELIANDKELLDEFNKESQRSQKLMQYLIRYLEKQ